MIPVSSVLTWARGKIRRRGIRVFQLDGTDLEAGLDIVQRRHLRDGLDVAELDGGKSVQERHELMPTDDQRAEDRKAGRGEALLGVAEGRHRVSSQENDGLALGHGFVRKIDDPVSVQVGGTIGDLIELVPPGVLELVRDPQLVQIRPIHEHDLGLNGDLRDPDVQLTQ